MKRSQVTVRFDGGLHARPATRLVRLLERFRARVFLRFGDRVANAGSILSILLLSATFNSQIELQASGEEEDAAIRAAEAFFQSSDEEVAQNAESKSLVDGGPERQTQDW